MSTHNELCVLCGLAKGAVAEEPGFMILLRGDTEFKEHAHVFCACAMVMMSEDEQHPHPLGSFRASWVGACGGAASDPNLAERTKAAMQFLEEFLGGREKKAIKRLSLSEDRFAELMAAAMQRVASHQGGNPLN